MSPFRHRLRVRYSDCDPQGVVFNANYLTYFDIAITELWRRALGPYQEVTSERGIDLVVAEAGVRYLAPIGFDEEVELVAAVGRIGTTSMTTALAIETEAETAARGELRHVCVRHGTVEKVAIPDDVREALSGFWA